MFNQNQQVGHDIFMRSENNIGESKQTSVKVHNPPGGRGNFDLSHHNGGERGRFTGGVNPQPQMTNPGHTVDPSGKKFKPSVRVHNPPGKNNTL